MSFAIRFTNILKEKGIQLKAFHASLRDIRHNSIRVISYRTFQDYKSGRASPTLNTVKLIAQGLGVDYHYLLSGDSSKKKLDEIAQLIDHPEQAKLDYLIIIKKIIESEE